jgi:hypothetical protein
MPEANQVVKFTENYNDDETRNAYYRGDKVEVTAGEYRRASALGAVELVAEDDQEDVKQVQGGVAVPEDMVPSSEDDDSQG